MCWYKLQTLAAVRAVRVIAILFQTAIYVSTSGCSLQYTHVKCAFRGQF
jgi:hypothetical protein